jgi:putative N-acetylmannosamine-6-phosphate epimerase
MAKETGKCSCGGGSEVDPKLREALLEAAPEGKIACPQAREIAESLGVDPKVVGRACNKLQIKITGCALGLFEVEPQIKEALLKAAPEGKITCTQARQIAEELGVSPLLIGIACNRLNIKVKECALGCFG